MMRWSASRSSEYCFCDNTARPSLCGAARSCPESGEYAAPGDTSSVRTSMWPRTPDAVCGVAYSPTAFLVHIVKRQPVLHPVSSGIRCRQPFGVVGMTPDLASLRPDFQGAKLVEGYRGTIGGGLIHISANYFFLDLSLGSLHSFQVFIRRSLTFFS